MGKLERRVSPRSVGGCRIKPFEKARSTLAEVHLRAAVHDALATDRLCATDVMAVFGTHPYKRSSGLAKGFPTATSISSTVRLRSNSAYERRARQR